MADNPTNYDLNLPRVSSLVEFKFPFIWNKKDRFLSWLNDKWILLEDYMEEACSGGTYVHKAMEDYWYWLKPKVRKYKDIILNWIKLHNDRQIKTIYSEYYVKCKEYQWTIDRIATMDGDDDTIWIIDFKTWSLAKLKFWITTIYRKPYEKLVKARYQLYLYKRALSKIKEFKWKKIRMCIAELNENWYYVYPLEDVDEKEIKTLLKEFNNRYADEL